MADIAGAVAAFLALGNCVVQPIKRQLNYLCCFSSNIQDFGGEKKKLVDVKDGLQMRVTTALNNAEIIVPEVETWLKDADEIQEKIIGIESEITNIQGGSCLAVRSRYSLSKKIKKTTEAMKELRNKCRFDPIAERAPPPAMEPLPLGSTIEFESRRKIENDIITCLKDEEVNMLGICGMGGVGKTTMAKRVMNRARAHHLFDEIVIAVVSQPADMSKVQNEMAESLGLKLEDETLSARAHKLRIRLMGGKRILIVLDDVWMSLNLEDLGIPRESGSKGCTILLTSRDKDVLNEMEAHKIFGISTLSNKEAWYLFREKAGVCADDPNLLSIAQEIVQECKGLPIAIVNVAAALKDKKHKYTWDDARQQLRNSNPVDMPKVIQHVYKPLKLSYDFLESENAQSIFLLCCLFPEDSRILIEDLTAYVWGLRMFEGNRDLEEVRNMTYSLVEMLKSRFLLLEVDQDEDYVRMHDVVRDVAIFIASKEKQLVKCGANSTWLSPSLGQRMEEISNGMDFQNLRLLMTDESVSDISFEGMRDLNVLSMTSLPSLPRTTQLLKSLRTLILDSCSLKSISGIGELVDLEILICRYTYIEELPVEMSRLVRLMKLEISDCWALRTIVPDIISSLVALKELKMKGSFRGWEGNEGGRKNASLGELQSLSSLTCLTIRIDDPALAAQHMVLSKIVKYYIDIGEVYTEQPIRPHGEFEKIILMDLPREITSLGNWVLECIRRVEYLLLLGEGSNVVDLGQAQNMRVLIFRQCSTAKKLVNITISSSGSTTVFPHLEYLELRDLANLDDLCHIDGPIPKGSISINAFKNLKELSLHNLPVLKHLWEYNNTYHNCLPQVERLEISTCRIMEQVLFCNEEEEGKVIRFPKLETLILRDLPRLFSFSKGIGRIEFFHLTDVTINSCLHLKSLVSITKNSGGINHLQDGGCLHQEKVTFGMLKNLEMVNTSSNNTSKLWFYQIPPNSFTGLERLCIRNFGNIGSLFSSSTARNLGNLKILQIHDCEEMINVIDDEETGEILNNVFNNLKELRLEDLPALKHLWKCSNTNSCLLQQLQKLVIVRCGMMEQVFLWENQGNDKEQTKSKITITFPELKRLELFDLPMLTTLCKGIESIEFPQLTDMVISNCPQLKSLLPSGNNLFCQPKKVAIGGLKDLQIWENDIISNSSSLWCDQIPTHGFFTGLEKLSIGYFSNLRSLFSSSIASNLNNLRMLNVCGCEEMVKVIEDDDREKDASCELSKIRLFPLLHRLRIDELPKLEIFCEWRSCVVVELPLLKTVTISGCPKMERFNLGSLITPNLEGIIIDHEHVINTKDLNFILQQQVSRVEEVEDKKTTSGEIVEEEEN